MPPGAKEAGVKSIVEKRCLLPIAETLAVLEEDGDKHYELKTCPGMACKDLTSA